MMGRPLAILGILSMALPGLIQANDPNCQRTAYLKSEFGSITEPLYPDQSTPDGVGLRSCWFFNHTLKEDYIVGVELKSIDVGSTLDSSLWFSDNSPIYRTKKSPFCFLYIRGNNTCSKDRAVSAMNGFMPNCRGNTKVIEVKSIPSSVLLSSNVINAWRVKTFRFQVDYRFLPCGVSNPSGNVPAGGGFVDVPAAGTPSSSQPCVNANVGKLSQNTSTNLLPVVIVLAVILGIETMILFVVIMRYRRMLRYTKEERHFTKVLHTNGREISPSEYGQMQVQLRS